MSTSESGRRHPVPGIWDAHYFDGITAAKQQARVRPIDGGLEITIGDQRPRFWPYFAVRQAQGTHVNEQLRLEIDNDPIEAIVVDDPGLPEAIIRQGGSLSTRVAPQSGRLKVVGVVGAIIAGIAALYFLGAPALADWLSNRVPASWEVALGRDAERQLVPVHQRCTEPEAVAAARAMLDRLIAPLGETEYDFRLHLIKSPQVNAFAAPGGLIAINTGLLHDATSAEEVAGVLAHEVQHVTKRHSTRGIFREIPLRLAIAAIAGDGGVASAATAIGALGSMSYQRDDEREADREGMRLLAAAGIDPNPSIAFMQRLQDREGGEPSLFAYLSTHPQPGDRVAELRALAAQQQGPTRPILDPAAFAALKGACKTP